MTVCSKTVQMDRQRCVYAVVCACPDLRCSPHDSRRRHSHDVTTGRRVSHASGSGSENLACRNLVVTHSFIPQEHRNVVELSVGAGFFLELLTYCIMLKNYFF